jgi:hypothetical protein
MKPSLQFLDVDITEINKEVNDCLTSSVAVFGYCCHLRFNSDITAA